MILLVVANATHVGVERAASEQAARGADGDRHEEAARGGSMSTVEFAVESDLEQETLTFL